MFKRIAIFLSLTWLTLIRLTASEDSIRVSLLTCSPGQEVYSLYGHTAIRCQQPADSMDLVFNYGVFDMSKPHFVWHFILGQTDYMVAAIPWKYFTIEYEERGSSITEQELNLTPFEARMLTNLLAENCRPENRNYRYNYLTRNCTTRVRDMVEQVIRGRILYPDTLPHQTTRELLHRYTAGHSWAQEGNDLLLGADVDTIMSARAAMFIPENLMQAFDGAIILDGKGNQRPLVRSKEMPLAPTSKTLSDSPLNGEKQALWNTLPLREGWSWSGVLIVFPALCLVIMLLEAWSKRLFWLWDVVLLLALGTAGTLLTFMFLFSEHPAVGSNWQIWVFNPIAFVGIPLVIKAAIRHQTTLWYAFHFTLLALFLLFSPWIPQVFAKITVPLALCLLTRPISYYYFCRRKKRHER